MRSPPVSYQPMYKATSITQCDQSFTLNLHLRSTTHIPRDFHLSLFSYSSHAKSTCAWLPLYQAILTGARPVIPTRSPPDQTWTKRSAPFTPRTEDSRPKWKSVRSDAGEAFPQIPILICIVRSVGAAACALMAAASFPAALPQAFTWNSKILLSRPWTLAHAYYYTERQAGNNLSKTASLGKRTKKKADAHMQIRPTSLVCAVICLSFLCVCFGDNLVQVLRQRQNEREKLGKKMERGRGKG